MAGMICPLMEEHFIDLFEKWSSSMQLDKGFRLLNFSGNPNLEEWIAAKTEAIYINCGELRCDAVMIAFKAIHLRIM